MHLKGINGKISPAQWMEELFAFHPEYSDIDVAVETGTFRGDGPLWFSKFFEEIHTVEINEGLHNLAKTRCATCESLDKITFHLGDSAIVVPVLAEQIKKPVLWLLDAHFCLWAKAKEWNEPCPVRGNFPLWAELEAISKRPYADIVLVDDSPVFGVSRDKDRVPGDTSPQWESVSDEVITKALGRVIDSVEWQKSQIYWRTPLSILTKESL